MRRLTIAALVSLLICSGLSCRPAALPDETAVHPAAEDPLPLAEAEPPPAPEGFTFTLRPDGNGGGRLAGVIVDGRPGRLVVDLFLPRWAEVAGVRLEDELVVVLDHAAAAVPWTPSHADKFVLECSFSPEAPSPAAVRFTDPRGSPLEQRLDLEAAIAVVRREVAPYFGLPAWAFVLEPGCRLAWLLPLGHGESVLNARGDALVSGSARVDAMTGEILEYPARYHPYPTRAWLREAGWPWPAGVLGDGRLLFRTYGGEWLAVTADGELERLAAEPAAVSLTELRESPRYGLVHEFLFPEAGGGGLRLTLAGAGGEEIDLAGRLAELDPRLRLHELVWHQWWPGPGDPEVLFLSLELDGPRAEGSWLGRFFRYHLAGGRLEELFILPEGARFHVFPCGRVIAFGWSNSIVLKDIPAP